LMKGGSDAIVHSGDVVGGGVGNGVRDSNGEIVFGSRGGNRPLSSRGRTVRWSPRAVRRRDTMAPSGRSRAGVNGEKGLLGSCGNSAIEAEAVNEIKRHV
jgi:hypothetical protein